MVTHINVAVDDDLAERGRAIKKEKNWSWEQFYKHAVEEFEDDEEN